MSVIEQHPSVYAHIGQRIRERRKLLQLNQSQLAQLMGFSYQQMQKYETGTSQASAGKLLLFAKILNVPPSYFYEGIQMNPAIGKRIDSDIIQKRAETFSILLVENTINDALAFQQALRHCPHPAKAHILHHAEAAMDYLQHHRPDLIITALELPKTGGMALLQHTKKDPHALHTPVVIFTNSISAKDMMEAYRYGAAGFIQKPAEPQEYRETIRSIIAYWAKTVVLPTG